LGRNERGAAGDRALIEIDLIDRERVGTPAAA